MTERDKEKIDATVLVVEDDILVRMPIAAYLRHCGYRVIEAGDGPTALAALDAAAEPIDLLFTDVVLPGGMTGADIARAAKAKQPGLRVLFTTGYARNAIIHHGRLDPGGSKHLLPVDAEEAHAVHHHHQKRSCGRNGGRIHRRQPDQFRLCLRILEADERAQDQRGWRDYAAAA